MPFGLIGKLARHRAVATYQEAFVAVADTAAGHLHAGGIFLTLDVFLIGSPTAVVEETVFFKHKFGAALFAQHQACQVAVALGVEVYLGGKTGTVTHLVNQAHGCGQVTLLNGSLGLVEHNLGKTEIYPCPVSRPFVGTAVPLTEFVVVITSTRIVAGIVAQLAVAAGIGGDG